MDLLTEMAASPAKAGRASGMAYGADVMLTASLADVVLFIMLLGALGAAALLALRAWREGHGSYDSEGDDLPPLVFPTPPPRRQVADRSQPAGTADGGPALPVALPKPAAVPASQPVVSRRVASGDSAKPRKPPARKRANGKKASDMADATLQILPGRLEVLGGDAGLEEIRFVRGAGSETSITLGRSEGAAPGHVQLRSAAVSRLHARMRFHDNSWFVTNLSQTNPTLVNGVALEPDGGELMLRDGDQLELGDVVLRFRS